MRPPNKTADETKPLPSNGGTPYPQHTRLSYQRQLETGIEPGDAYTASQRQQGLQPSSRTLRRWRQQFAARGHTKPFRRTGNRRSGILRGNDLVHLAVYRMLFPKTTTAEINAYIGRMNFGNPNQRFYSGSQIKEAEDRLGFSRKVGSTTAYQALLPINLAKRQAYWNRQYPFGMADIRRQDIIDLDEAGVFVESADRKYGNCEVGRRVKQAGPYTKGVKLNILMAISGDPNGINDRRHWEHTWTDGGTTNERFIDFMEYLMNSLPHGDEGRRFCITMDNLNAHLNGQVLALIADRGHKICFRAPYYPIDGAIEYVFNTLQVRLSLRMSYIVNENTLRNELLDSIGVIQTYVPYFEHVGFWRIE